MSTDLVELSPVGGTHRASGVIVPALIGEAGEGAARRFLEFFTANISNPNTRAAYVQAVGQFLRWAEEHRLSLQTIEPIAVAAYVEQLQGRLAAPSVKQHLAAIRELFNWLVTGQVVPTNPAASVKGPKHVVKKGKTFVLSPEDARSLIASIDVSTTTGLRDRALLGVMVYRFARIGAVVGMSVEDYYPNGKRWWIRLQEKGGKFHEVPAHHKVEEFLDAYLKASGLEGQKKAPLFQSVKGKTGTLSGRPLHADNALHMVKRRAKAAGLSDRVCCHTFRATGITAYLSNGGTIENAQIIAAHESPRTTKLYDPRTDEVSLDEIERISI